LSNSKHAAHHDVVDAGIKKNIPFCHKPVSGVKALSVQLRGQFNLKMPVTPRFVHQGRENHGAEPLAPINLSHRESPYVPIGKQTTCGGRMFSVVNDRVYAAGVVLVELEFRWNFLLQYEDLVTNAGGILFTQWPVTDDQSKLTRILIVHFVLAKLKTGVDPKFFLPKRRLG